MQLRTRAIAPKVLVRGRVKRLSVAVLVDGAYKKGANGEVTYEPRRQEELDRIAALVNVREFSEDQNLIFATRNGTVKKTALSEFSRPRPSGIIAVNLEDGDYLIGVALTDGKQDMMLFSDAGKAMRFAEDEVRPMGRNAAGVRGMKLPDGGQVISLLTAADENVSVLTATENGYGKRTLAYEIRTTGRGGKGIISVFE